MAFNPQKLLEWVETVDLGAAHEAFTIYLQSRECAAKAALLTFIQGLGFRV